MRPADRAARSTDREELRILAAVGGFSATGALLSLAAALGPSHVGQAITAGVAALLFVAISVGFGYELAAVAGAQEF